MHGSERRTDWPIDVPDDRLADDGRRNIQVILIESATIIRNQLRIGLKRSVGHSVRSLYKKYIKFATQSAAARSVERARMRMSASLDRE